MLQQLLGMINREEEVKTIGQLDETAEEKEKAAAKYRPPTTEQNLQKNIEKDAENFAINLSNILTGTNEQVAQGMAYMRAKGADIIKNPAGKPAGVYLNTPQGLVAFESKGDLTAATRGLAGALITATNAGIPEDMVVNKAKNRLGNRFNTSYTGTGGVAEEDYRPVLQSTVKDVVTPDKFFGKNSAKVAPELKKALASIPTLSVTDKGSYTAGNAVDRNKIEVKIGTNAPITISSRSENPADDIQALYDYIENTLSKAQAQKFIQSISSRTPAQKPNQQQKPKTGELDN
jgi:hypothetical protein